MLTKFPAGAMLLNAYMYYHEKVGDDWTKIDYDMFPQMNITNEQVYNQV